MELTKQALFNVATERFKSWSKMYADPDVTPEYMYEDMCASCLSGDLDFDLEDRYNYTEEGACYFLHRGIRFTVIDLRDMRENPRTGNASYYDICICACEHRDPDGPEDDAYWPHFMSDAWLFGSTSSDFEPGKKVDARFISEADKYIDRIGRDKLIELQKQED